MSAPIENVSENAPNIMRKSFVSEFFEFVQKYGVVGLALGVVVGQAVTTLVKSMVDNLINPLLGLLPNISSLKDLKLQFFGKDILYYGAFLADFINFLVLMGIVFFTVKFLIGKFMTDTEKTNIKTS